MSIEPPVDGELIRITEHFRALDTGPLAALETGLMAMAAGDFALVLDLPAEAPAPDDASAGVRALVDLYNGMLGRIHGAAIAYEALRAELARGLGEQSCLPELLQALRSLNDHCLTDLDRGLQAMADGDLTLAARPVTRPLRPESGMALGEVGEVFNEMLARSRTALRSYDAVREDLRALLGDQSCLDELRLRLCSLQRHCLRDLEEALEAMAEGTALTRDVAPHTTPIDSAPGAEPGELAGLFNRALHRARTAVEHLSSLRRSEMEPGHG